MPKDCFVAKTKILMSTETLKNIEDIEVGDIVKSWNEITNKVENSKVVKLIQPVHDDMLIIRFSNGVVNENTFDHPYYVKDKGWCSYSPNLTKERYDINTESLEIGDVCYFNNSTLNKYYKTKNFINFYLFAYLFQQYIALVFILPL